MKRIISDDRVLVYKVECARFSYRLAERAWGRLTGSIETIRELGELTDAFGLDVFFHAWSFVDFAARHFNALTTIPGIDRKDIRYKNFAAKSKLLSGVRNYIQHVDQEAHKIRNDPVSPPILGAMAWGAADGATSFTIFLGTAPSDTAFYTATYDVDTQHFLSGIFLSVGELTIELKEIFALCSAAARQLDEHLTATGLLGGEDVRLGKLYIPASGIPLDRLPEIPAGKRFARIAAIVRGG